LENQRYTNEPSLCQISDQSVLNYKSPFMKNRLILLLLAAFPVMVSPALAGIAQQTYLKASNTTQYALFGNSVAVSGDTTVVAAYGESSSATGVNGDQNNGDAEGSGAAYVFRSERNNLEAAGLSESSNTDISDAFGSTVAISGDTVVVGAYHEDSNATGGGWRWKR